MLYSELQCSEAIHKAVERMGFAEMTEVQEKTIPVMLAGRDVIAKAPTGTGKTCAFGIPVAEHIDPALKAPQAVILAPTRELAQQIAEELTGLTYFMPEVQVVCVYGGANMEKQAKRLAEGCQIVVATPGRLMDHYKHHNIDLDHVTQVVLDEADEMGKNDFGPTPLDFSWLATDKETDEVMLRMEECFISRENYHEKYEAALMDMIQCAFIRSEKEVTQNKVLDDGEVIQRLRTLTHLKNMDYWKISRAVWAASTMSRAVLKRVDAENIPIRAQQIVVPILAVGLCYDLESEAVSLIAKYILMFVAMKSAPDDAIRAAFCHHCENYIALMEYYAPSEHCMEATTRT